MIAIFAPMAVLLVRVPPSPECGLISFYQQGAAANARRADPDKMSPGSVPDP
jgi:hypothetical protein